MRELGLEFESSGTTAGRTLQEGSAAEMNRIRNREQASVTSQFCILPTFA